MGMFKKFFWSVLFVYGLFCAYSWGKRVGFDEGFETGVRATLLQMTLHENTKLSVYAKIQLDKLG